MSNLFVLDGVVDGFGENVEFDGFALLDGPRRRLHPRGQGFETQNFLFFAVVTVVFEAEVRQLVPKVKTLGYLKFFLKQD